MLRLERNGIVTYHFESLQGEGLTHAVFTRLGGTSQGPFATLNVGHSVGDDPEAVAENHTRVYNHLGLAAGQVATAHQVHGSHVVAVTAGQGGQVAPKTDGLATSTPGLALLLRFADCQPILLYDPIRHCLALAHAGWRGAALGITYRAVEMMRDTFGSRAENLVAGLGPAIGPCCYTVGHDVAAAMGYALPDWHQVMTPHDDVWKFDLSAANAQQLAAAGVQHIEEAHLCTACHQDEFFSHRADNGQTGRFAVVAFLEPARGDRYEDDTAPTPLQGVADDEQAAAQDSWPDSLNPPGFPALGDTQGLDA